MPPVTATPVHSATCAVMMLGTRRCRITEASPAVITSMPMESSQRTPLLSVQRPIARPNSSIGAPTTMPSSSARWPGSWNRSCSSRAASGVAAAMMIAPTAKAIVSGVGRINVTMPLSSRMPAITPAIHIQFGSIRSSRALRSEGRRPLAAWAVRRASRGGAAGCVDAPAEGARTGSAAASTACLAGASATGRAGCAESELSSWRAGWLAIVPAPCAMSF